MIIEILIITNDIKMINTQIHRNKKKNVTKKNWILHLELLNIKFLGQHLIHYTDKLINTTMFFTKYTNTKL